MELVSHKNITKYQMDKLGDKPFMVKCVLHFSGIYLTVSRRLGSARGGSECLFDLLLTKSKAKSLHEGSAIKAAGPLFSGPLLFGEVLGCYSGKGRRCY
jgi:hypothetical protein